MIIDKDRLPPRWPVHQMDDAFWAALGRAIGTFGRLERTLQQAVFQMEGSRHLPASDEEARAAVDEWAESLKQTITDTLTPLARAFVRAARMHEGANGPAVMILGADIETVAPFRNALCHAAWSPKGADRAEAGFVSRKLEVLDREITVADLDQYQRHTAELTIDVINTVTSLGLGFPGLDVPYEKAAPAKERP